MASELSPEAAGVVLSQPDRGAMAPPSGQKDIPDPKSTSAYHMSLAWGDTYPIGIHHPPPTGVLQVVSMGEPQATMGWQTLFSKEHGLWYYVKGERWRWVHPNEWVTHRKAKYFLQLMRHGQGTPVAVDEHGRPKLPAQDTRRHEDWKKARAREALEEPIEDAD